MGPEDATIPARGNGSREVALQLVVPPTPVLMLVLLSLGLVDQDSVMTLVPEPGLPEVAPPPVVPPTLLLMRVRLCPELVVPDSVMTIVLGRGSREAVYLSMPVGFVVTLALSSPELVDPNNAMILLVPET